MPSCFPGFSGLVLLPHNTSVPVELEDQQGLGQGRENDEGRREKKRNGKRKTDKEGRENEAKRKGVHCNWSLPFRGWSAVFLVIFFFFLSQWSWATLGLDRVVEIFLGLPHSGRGFTKVQSIMLIS